MFTNCRSGTCTRFSSAMTPIEIRLDPKLVATLLETISPTLEKLESELATPAEPPADDAVMEGFWRNDLLEAQRDEVAAVAELFDEDFMETGRAVIPAENMERVLRACSAIRLKLRETALKPLTDGQLERGELDDVQWTDDLRIGYGCYSLFASLQELIVAQMENPLADDLEEGEGEEADDDGDKL